MNDVTPRICKTRADAVERLEEGLLQPKLPGFTPGSPLCKEVHPFIGWFVEEGALTKHENGVYLFNPEKFRDLMKRQ